MIHVGIIADELDARFILMAASKGALSPELRQKLEQLKQHDTGGGASVFESALYKAADSIIQSVGSQEAAKDAVSKMEDTKILHLLERSIAEIQGEAGRGRVSER